MLIKNNGIGIRTKTKLSPTIPFVLRVSLRAKLLRKTSVIKAVEKVI